MQDFLDSVRRSRVFRPTSDEANQENQPPFPSLLADKVTYIHKSTLLIRPSSSSSPPNYHHRTNGTSDFVEERSVKWSRPCAPPSAAMDSQKICIPLLTDVYWINRDNLNGRLDEPLEDNDSALHPACLYGHLPCVQLLLERGADMEVNDEDEAFPLHDACAGGYLVIIQLLFSRATGPNSLKRMIETADIEGDTPLHHAARGEHVDVIRFLLGSRASPTT